jgi:hypothetical protein
MAIFSTCRRCGCKAVVVVIVGALFHSAVHQQDLCLRDQPNPQALYCTKYVAEPVHTHEDGPSNHQAPRSVTVVTSTSSAGTFSSGGWTTNSS